MIYVDKPTWQKPNGRKFYAHMVCESNEELHAFAKVIGVKRHFFHGGDKPHYDISVEQHALALENGAVEVSSKQLVAILTCKGVSKYEV